MSVTNQDMARCYVESVDGGKLYRSTENAVPEREFQFDPGEMPAAWTLDSKFFYLVQNETTRVIVTRFEVASGRRQFWKEISAPPAHAEMKGEEVALTPDGQSFAFTYSRHLSDLYLVSGLK